jgi:peptidoglycan/LPS O-acetylase OafA/YrhL
MKNSNSATIRRERLDPLTTWRFFAAASVVFYHCTNGVFLAAPAWFHNLTQNGYQAVTFFFVLSGFVLVYNYHKADAASGLKGTRGGFWIARMARICPTYILALCIALPAYFYYGLVKQTISPISFGLGLLFTPLLLQAWLPIAGVWNGPAWSLSVEGFFYLCFPKFVQYLARKTWRWCFWVALVGVVSFNLVRYYLCPLSESGAATEPEGYLHHFCAYFPLAHLPTFIFGMALCKAHLSLPSEVRQRYQNSILLVSLGILLTLFCLHGRISPIFLSDTLLVPLYGAIVFASANCTGTLNRILSHRWLVELGEASYAIYILHIPLVWWATRVKSLFPAFPDKDNVFFCCYFVALLGTCVFIYERFEKPMKKWVTHRLGTAFLKPTGKESSASEAGIRHIPEPTTPLELHSGSPRPLMTPPFSNLDVDG